MSADGIVWDGESTAAPSAAPVLRPPNVAAASTAAPADGIQWDSQSTAAPKAPALQNPQGRSLLRAAGDVGVSLAQGTVSAGMFVPQLANTLTGGAVDKYVFKPVTGAVDSALGGPGEGSTLAEASQNTRTALNTLKSPYLQQKDQELADTKGFLPTAKKILTTPSLLVEQAAEQVPQLVAPGGVVRKAGAMAFERAAGNALAKGVEKRVAAGMTEEAATKAATAAAERLGQRAAIKAGTKAAIGTEAAMSASQNSEQAQQQVMGLDQKVLDANPDYQAMVARGVTPQAAREALAQQAGIRAGAAGAAITAATGGLTGKLESKIFQGETGVHGVGQLFTGAGAKELAKAVGKETAQEGLQEGGEQFGQNLGVQHVDPNQSLMDQVPENAALGAVLGGTIGAGTFAGSAALSHPHVANVPNPDAKPGSLSDAANVLAEPAGPMGRAAQAAQVGGLRPSDAAAEAAGAPPLPAPPAETAPAAAAAPAAPPAASIEQRPAVPLPWVNPQTGEVGTPTKGQLTQALADHIVQTFDTQGHMRINADDLAAQWGVTKKMINQVRPAAQDSANNRVRASQGPALNEPSGDTGWLPDATATEAGSPAAAEPSPAATDRQTSAATSADAAAAQAVTPAPQASQSPADVSAQAQDQQGPVDATSGSTSGTAAKNTLPAQGSLAENTTNVVGQESSSAEKPDDVPSQPAAQGNGVDSAAGRAGGEGQGGAASEAAARVPGQAPQEEAAAARAGVPATETAQPAPAVAANETPPTGGVSASGAAPTHKVSAAARDAEGMRVKTPTGETNGRSHVDSLIKDGFTKVDSRRAGDKLVHSLVNAAGEHAPIKARQLKYAQEASARHTDEARQQIDAAAHEAATSPTNDTPEPTKPQIEANNYKLGHITVHGLDISIENPRGSTRSGVGENGKPWSHVMSDHYGYIRRTTGADGEHVDTYVGAHPDSKRVYVVDQLDQKTGAFDEHKVMLGFRAKGDAVRAYKSNFDPGWKVGNVKDMTVDQFKAWLKDGDTTKPAATASDVNQSLTTEPTAAATGKDSLKVAAKPVVKRGGIATNGAKVRVAGGKLQYVPRARETIEAYFKPGDVVPSYGGQDRVISTDFSDQGNPLIRVISVDKDGNAKPNERERVHGTMPTERELVSKLGKPVLPEKSNAAAITIGDRVLVKRGAYKGKTGTVSRVGGTDVSITLDGGARVSIAKVAVVAAPVETDKAPVALFSRDADAASAEPFYSALTRSVDTAKGAPKSADASAWKQWMDGAQRRGEFKQAEREWLGVDQWLGEQKGPVSREQLQQFVRDNQVQVQELELGSGVVGAEPQVQPRKVSSLSPQDRATAERDIAAGRYSRFGIRSDHDWVIFDGNKALMVPRRNDGGLLTEDDANEVAERLTQSMSMAKKASATKFEGYQLPGGTNYRELLLTLPQKLTPEERISQVMREKYGTNWLRVMDDTDRQAYLKVATQRQSDQGNFQSSHFDQSNILAHVRFNERTDADGKKVLFLEEVQSDWHQAGRRHGYQGAAGADPITPAEFEEFRALGRRSADSLTPAENARYDELRARNESKDSNAVPDAPFKKEWPMLAMKRMVRYAAENGFDRIAWTTGEQQAARYDLSKQLDTIAYSKSEDGKTVSLQARKGDHSVFNRRNVPVDDLPDIVGKDVADKIAAGGGELNRQTGYNELSGLDLKVGGEGMQAFYDRMLPNEVNKWAKPFGGKVAETSVSADADGWHITPPSGTVSGKWMVKSNDYNSKGLQFDTEDAAKAALAEKVGKVGVHGLDITPAMRTAALGGLPLFRQTNTTTSTAAPVTAAQEAHTAKVKQIATAAMGKWKGDDVPNLRVVATPEQLPAAAKVAANGLPGTAYKTAAGMYDGRTIWIVASAHNWDKTGIRKILKTMAHEGVGHYGIERIVERELGAGAWTKIVGSLERLRKNPELASPAIRSVLDDVSKRYPGADPLTFAKEFLAVTAERGVKNGLLDRVITALRRWVRRMGEAMQNHTALRGAGDHMAELRLSEHEFRQLLVASDQYLRVGESQQQRVQSRAAMAFSKDDQTGTPAFKRWFGQSKVTDSAGNPLPVYHGTADDFEAFDPNRSGSATAHMTANLGTFFAEDQAKAKHYAENASGGVPAEERVIDAYLSIQKPYNMSLKQFMGIDSQEESTALREKLVAEGYDGIHLKDVGQWVAFQPTQIKSASENRGTFDPGNPNIYFSRDENADPDSPKPARRSFTDAAASIEAIHDTLPQLDRSAFQQVKDWISGKARDLEPLALGALQLRHVLELASEDPTLKKPAQEYANIYQRMDGDRNSLTIDGASKVDALVKWARKPGLAGWLGKVRPEAKRLFDFMNAVTQLAVDPTNQYERLLMRDAGNEYKPWTKELIKKRIEVLRETAKTRSGDDKTRIYDEIKDLQKLPQREKVREQKYPELVRQWNALTPEAKEQFQVMRDHYREQSEALEEATLAHIASLDIPEANRRAAAALVNRNFAEARVDGVYFPLSRFGDYWISATTKDGKYVFAKYESANAMQQAEKRFLASGAIIEARGRQDNNYKAKDAPSGTFIGDLMGVLKNAPDNVKDEIYQMYLKALPNLSLRKHGIHRKNIAGFTADVPRAFASSVFHGAHQLSKARYGWQLTNTLEQMRERMEARRTVVSGTEAAHADALIGEIQRRHDWILNPTNNALSNKATGVAFGYFIAASPASALVNFIQVPQITLPVLAAQHGWGRATAVMTRAMKQAIGTGGHIDKVLTGEELEAYRALEKQGTFQRSATHALAGISEGDNLRSSPGYTKVMNAVSWMFHTSEVINREATGMAAFRLAREKGQSFQEALKYADQITNGTHGDYSNANRARYMQGNVQKVVLQFKNYSLAMSWLWGRNFYKAFKGEDAATRTLARRTLTGMLGMTGLFAGLIGMPIFNLLRYGAQAVHAAAGDDDEPWDFVTEFRSWLAEHLGQTAADVIADGAVSQLGANVASRVSMSDLWFRDADRQLEGEDAYNNMLQSIAGPLGGMIKNMYVGAQQFSDGHTERGIETMLPTFAKNAVKATRFASQGVNTLRGDPIVSDVSAPQALIQAIGFQPTKVAEQQRINNALFNYQKFVQDRRQQLMNAFAMAQQAGDDDGRSATLSKIQAFNQKYPEIAIRMSNLHASLRQRARFSAEADNGIRLNKRLANRVRSEVGAMAEQ